MDFWASVTTLSPIHTHFGKKPNRTSTEGFLQRPIGNCHYILSWPQAQKDRNVLEGHVLNIKRGKSKAPPEITYRKQKQLSPEPTCDVPTGRTFIQQGASDLLCLCSYSYDREESQHLVWLPSALGWPTHPYLPGTCFQCGHWVLHPKNPLVTGEPGWSVPPRSSIEGASCTEAPTAHVIYVMGQCRGMTEGPGRARARLHLENVPWRRNRWEMCIEAQRSRAEVQLLQCVQGQGQTLACHSWARWQIGTCSKTTFHCGQLYRETGRKLFSLAKVIYSPGLWCWR